MGEEGEEALSFVVSKFLVWPSGIGTSDENYIFQEMVRFQHRT